MSKKEELVSQSVANGAIILATAMILAKFLGFFRDRLLTSYFGAGRTLDMYFTAFKLPDFIFNILVLGALSSSFIPVFLTYWHKKTAKDHQSESWYLTNAVFHLMFVALVVLCLFAFIFARPLVALLAIGFDAQQMDISVALTRIMLLGVVFFGLSNVVSGVLNSVRRFVAYSLAPIFYNVGIIFGIVVLYPLLNIYGLAVGVVFGAFLHLVVQLPSLFRVGYRYRLVWDTSFSGVREIVKLMIPRTFGVGISQINQMITNSIASILPAGSITVYNLANNVQALPISIFSVSLAISVFPIFSEAFIKNQTDRFVYYFSRTVRRILYFIIPCSIFILLLRAQFVRLIFGAGAFDWTDTILTAQTLGYFALSLFAQSLIPVLARSFYALHDSKTPVVVALQSMILNVVLAWLVAPYFGVIGLALAFTVSSIFNMVVLFVILRVRLGDLDDARIVDVIMKIVSVALFSGLMTRGVMEIMARLVNMRTFVGIFWQTAVSLLVGCVLYIFLTYWLKMEETHTLFEYWKKFRLKIFRRN